MKITDKKTIERLKAANKILTKTDADFKKYFYADSGVIYATNGHEIFMMELEGIENGVYTLNKISNKEFELIKLDIDINYPNIIPGIIEFAKDETATAEDFNICDVPGVYETAICRLVLNSGATFNFKFSEKLKKFGADFTVYYKDKTSPILWETKGLIYVLMPIKI